VRNPKRRYVFFLYRLEELSRTIYVAGGLYVRHLFTARARRLPAEKLLFWIGSSKSDLLKFPEAVKHEVAWRLASLSLVANIQRQNRGRAKVRAFWNQPKISALSNYWLDGFSVERLMHFLNALGRDVVIVIRKYRSRRAAKTHVTAA